ncbi:uncharacterized protein TNCV_1262861 [Trichonephila clavipes]|nr:uncharacterized protein TNCV_1262861 [Trichonephila clavipes]
MATSKAGKKSLILSCKTVSQRTSRTRTLTPMVLRGGNSSGLVLVFSSRENLQKGRSACLFTCTGNILNGRRPCQDHPLGQDIVTGNEVPQHRWQEADHLAEGTVSPESLVITPIIEASDDPSSTELYLFEFLKICNGGATVNWNAILQDGPDNRDVRVSQSASICSPITSRDISQDVKPFSCLKYNIVNIFVCQNLRVQ